MKLKCFYLQILQKHIIFYLNFIMHFINSIAKNPTVHLILRHLKDPIVAEFPYILNLGGISIFRSALNFLYWGIGLLVGTCANVVCMICLLIPTAFFVFRS